MTALYELTSQYRQLAERLSEGDFDAQTISDTIEASGIVDDLQTKAQGVPYDNMVQHANERAANAIINVRYDANEVMSGVTEVLCYGTAVQVVNV